MAANSDGGLVHVSELIAENVFPDHFHFFLLPLLEQGWHGLKKVEIRGIMGRLLLNMRSELRGRGVILAGDGWEEEWNADATR
jgi:hypothetical protein